MKKQARSIAIYLKKRLTVPQRETVGLGREPVLASTDFTILRSEEKPRKRRERRFS